MVERYGRRRVLNVILMQRKVADPITRAGLRSIAGVAAVEYVGILHLNAVGDEVAIRIVAVPWIIEVGGAFRLIGDGVGIGIGEDATVGSRAERGLHIAVKECRLCGWPGEADVVTLVERMRIDLVGDGVAIGVIKVRGIVFERRPSARLAVAGEGATCPLLELTVRRWIDKPVIETVWHVVVIVIRAAARIPAWAKAHKDVIEHVRIAWLLSGKGYQTARI